MPAVAKGIILLNMSLNSPFGHPFYQTQEQDFQDGQDFQDEERDDAQERLLNPVNPVNPAQSCSILLMT